MSFKKGDKIVCIENEGVINYLTIGKVYNVSDITEKFLCVLDDLTTEHDFFQSRFRLATLLEKELSE